MNLGREAGKAEGRMRGVREEKKNKNPLLWGGQTL